MVSNGNARKVSFEKEDRVKCQMGYFSWRPKFLGKFNTPAVFTTVFSLSNFFLFIPYGALAVAVPTLEKVFSLNSRQTGLIFISNDISGMVAAVILGNLIGAKKIRWIGIGLITVAIAYLIPAASTLFVEYPQSKNISDVINDDTPDDTNVFSICGMAPELVKTSIVSEWAIRNHKFFYMFIAGYLLQGIGTSPPLTAGVTYLDEIYSQKKFGLAMAFLTIFSFIGHPIGMVLGSVFLNWYVTLSMPEGMTTDSKEFVGAWWLGWFIAAIVTFLMSFLVLLFPQQMPAAKKVLKEKIEKGITTVHEKNNELSFSPLKDAKRLIPSFKRLLKNWALEFLMIGDVFLTLQEGTRQYGPKIYAKLFRLKGTDVGKLLAIFHGVGFVVGVLSGGLLVKKKEWKPKKLLLIYVILNLVSTPFLLGILLYCPPHEHEPPVVKECNAQCTCTTELYDPVCDRSSQTTYFSPCFAGCTGRETDGAGMKVEHYTNCTCSTGDTSLVPGECGDPCSTRLWIALILSAVQNTIKYAGFVANNVIYQRIVAESDRTAAQGLRQFTRKALGSLPSPLLFGWIIDQNCDIWRTYQDGTVGNCWVYDISTLVMWLCIAQIVIRLISCAFHFFSYLSYPDKAPIVEDVDNTNRVEEIRI